MNRSSAVFLALLPALCLPAPGLASDSGLSEGTRTSAAEVRDAALRGSRAAGWVRSLTDRVGPRLAGSPGDKLAVAWALETMKSLGFSNVHAEPVTVPAWERGIETGEVTAPF